jgi:hypothetical protein
MRRMDKVFLITLLSVVGMALVANGTVALKNQWLGAYPEACPDLLQAADACVLCHGDGFALNPYGDDTGQFGIVGSEALDSDGDGVANVNEINDCTLPGDPASVRPIDPLSWAGIKALYR